MGTADGEGAAGGKARGLEAMGAISWGVVGLCALCA